MSQAKRIAIVGATGAVGLEMLRCLEQRQFPVRSIRLLASSRSAGRELEFDGEKISVEELTRDSFEGIDIAFFSAGGDISREFAPVAAEAGAVVVDNSSAFRLDERVPLVIPEINAAAAKARPKGIIANPNCTTIITLMGLYPLHRAFGLEAIIASSYQAVSGSGTRGIRELDEQLAQLARGGGISPSVYPKQIAHNVIPQVDDFQSDGYTREELKMRNESRKILDLPELSATCTCVRVPVHRSHAVSVTARFCKVPTVQAAREAFAGSPGIELLDNPAEQLYPTPLDCTGKDACLIGRIRLDQVLERALAVWIVGDQVRKGAALNAIQIAELL